LEQERPPEQELPQAPQLVELVWVLTQELPHQVCPVGHTQEPLEQERPPEQELPQAPQLVELAFRSTQL
jgi:hypothetical protein